MSIYRIRAALNAAIIAAAQSIGGKSFSRKSALIAEKVIRLLISAEGGCLAICHDISLVQQFCDRVLVMYHGDIVEQGAPDAVIYHPQNDYTKRLIDSVL